MCGEQTSSTSQQTYGTSELSGPTAKASNTIAKGITDALGNPYQGYNGPTEGKFGSTFGTAENAATARAGATDPNFAAGTSGLATGLNLAATTAGTPVSQLMSKYTDAALQPTLDAIQRQGAAANQGLATGATMAGAFGDTGYGTQKATNNYNTTQATAGAVGSAYDKAYNTALQTQQTGLSQLLGGVGQASSLGSASNSAQTNLEALLGSLGSTKQQANQTGINTAIGVNNQNQMGQYQQLGAAGSALGATPHDTTTFGGSSGTTTQPDNTGFGLLGSLAGGLSFNPASGAFHL